MILELILIILLNGCSSQAKLQQIPTSEETQLHIDLQNGKYDIDLESEEKKDKKKAALRNDDGDYEDYEVSDEVSEECDECDCDACTSKKDACCEQTCDNCNMAKESVMYVPYPYPVFVPNNIAWHDMNVTVTPNDTEFEPHGCPAGVAKCTPRNHRSLSLREQQNIENYQMNDEVPDGYRRANVKPLGQFNSDLRSDLLPTRRIDQSVFGKKTKEEDDFDIEEAKRQLEMLQREYAKLDQEELYQKKAPSDWESIYRPQPYQEDNYRRKDNEERLEARYQYVPKHPNTYKDDYKDPVYPLPYHDIPSHQKSYQDQNTYQDVSNRQKHFQDQSPYQDIPNYQKSSREQRISGAYQDVPAHQRHYQNVLPLQHKSNPDQNHFQDLPMNQKSYSDLTLPQDVPNHQKLYQDEIPHQDVSNHQKMYEDSILRQDVPAHPDHFSDLRKHQTSNKNIPFNQPNLHVHNMANHKKPDGLEPPLYKYEATQDQHYQSVNELLKALTGSR